MGGHSVLVQYDKALRFAYFSKQPRLGNQYVSIAKYMGVDRFEAYAPADVNVPHKSLRAAFKHVGEVFHVVPHAKACQLGRHAFPGDVELDVALMLQWGNMRQCDRERFLTPNELAEYRLWRNIPKRLKQPQQLTYDPSAPHYSASV